MMTLDDDIRFDNTLYLSKVNKSASSGPNETIAGVAEKLGISLEKDLKPNVEYLKAKRLSQSFDLIDKKALESRLMMGKLPLTTS